jgi:hypothetical protein
MVTFWLLLLKQIDYILTFVRFQKWFDVVVLAFKIEFHVYTLAFLATFREIEHFFSSSGHPGKFANSVGFTSAKFSTYSWFSPFLLSCMVDTCLDLLQSGKGKRKREVRKGQTRERQPLGVEREEEGRKEESAEHSPAIGDVEGRFTSG